MKILVLFSLSSLLFGSALTALAAEKLIPVDVTNFVRAETDLYFGRSAKVALGKFSHRRELTAIGDQSVVRMNRDTLYSSAVFDLDAGPVSITLPDPGPRFMSMQVISQDHYTLEVAYNPGCYQYTKDKVGTRYMFAAIRLLVDPRNPIDMQAAHRLQNAIAVEQARRGVFVVPRWDPVSQSKVRDALANLATTGTGLGAGNMFGRVGEVDPVLHLIGTAVGWGGNPRADAKYESYTPAANDGRTVHELVVKDVPVDGFWSVTVYNARGFFERNELESYSVNNLTAKRNTDSSVRVQFGGCSKETPNCLPIMPGWNYTVRLYRPRSEILARLWTFPVAKPIDRRLSAK